MLSLQDRMNNMKSYFRGIEMYNEALMVKVVFPDKWKCYPSADGRIKVTESETEANVLFYYADSKDTTYDDMFDLIEETIKENEEINLKLLLLKQKVDELKELFSSRSYEELQTLEFTFVKSKKTPTKKKTTKKAEKTSEEEEKKDGEA